MLAKLLEDNNQPKFRLEQVKKAIFQDGVFSFENITTISKELREKLKENLDILSFFPDKTLVSKDKRSIKALLKLKDGNLIETVFISPKPNIWSACISSQVGCPLGCGFCATGKGGFKRNLTAEEITDQILYWKQYMKKKGLAGVFSNIVYMGMGEPFLNWEEVSKSLRNLTDPDLFGFSSRSISVSTAGIPEGIEKLAMKFPQINLAVSLHFSADEKRDKFMPINKKHNLEKLKNSLRSYFTHCNRKVFLEYILLENVNDSLEDAQDLIKYLKSIGNFHLLHVNLIRYNSTSDKLKPSSSSVAREFKNYLLRNGVNVTIRKSLGEDIQGACGQLAGR